MPQLSNAVRSVILVAVIASCVSFRVATHSWWLTFIPLGLYLSWMLVNAFLHVRRLDRFYKQVLPGTGITPQEAYDHGIVIITKGSRVK